MKFFTHTYIIVFYENGRFCWNNKGWNKKTYEQLVSNAIFDWILIVFLAGMLII